MKLNKKIKWTLGVLGITTIVAVPMSVSLISCSKGDDGSSNSNDNNDNNKPSQDASLINDNFASNMQDLNKPFDDSTTQEQYNKIKLVADNWESKNKSGNLDASTAYDIANNWLNNATQKQIEDMLLINFNRKSWIYEETNDSSKTYVKEYLTLNITNYDFQNHLVSFEIVNIDSAYNFSNEYTQYIPDAISELKQVFKQVYKFENIKLIAVENINMPLISIDYNYPNTQIKCTFSDYQDTFYDIFSLSLRMLDYAKDHQMKDYEGILIEGEHYEWLKKDIEEQRKHYSNCYKGLSMLPELDWSSSTFKELDNFNLLDTYPFLNNLHSDNQFWEIGIIGGFDDTGKLHIEKGNFYIPYFAIAEFNSDNSDFNIVLSK